MDTTETLLTAAAIAIGVTVGCFLVGRAIDTTLDMVDDLLDSNHPADDLPDHHFDRKDTL